jgi:hypothetical protein
MLERSTSMCIYCGTKKYRKIYQNHFGKIPKDHTGRSYEIHHLDGNHDNNDPNNLKCVTIQKHYDIHFSQGDWGACFRINNRMSKTHEEISNDAKDLARRLVNEGSHHLLRRADGTSHASDAVKAGTHHFLGGRIQGETSRRRVEEGTHNFLDGTLSRAVQNELVSRNKHHFQNKIKKQCPHCSKIVDAGNYSRWHGDKCLSITHRKRTVPKIQCPHCGFLGGNTIMNRWHFDRCKRNKE